MVTVWAALKAFNGVVGSIALHPDFAAAERDLMEYVGAPEGTTYDEWAGMRDMETEPAGWYSYHYDDCKVMEADISFELERLLLPTPG